jgi:hypothetical protein
VTSESSGCASRAIREGFAFFEQKKHCKKLRNSCSLKTQSGPLTESLTAAAQPLDLLDVGRSPMNCLEESHITVYLNVSYEVQGFPY